MEPTELDPRLPTRVVTGAVFVIVLALVTITDLHTQLAATPGVADYVLKYEPPALKSNGDPAPRSLTTISLLLVTVFQFALAYLVTWGLVRLRYQSAVDWVRMSYENAAAVNDEKYGSPIDVEPEDTPDLSTPGTRPEAEARVFYGRNAVGFRPPAESEPPKPPSVPQTFHVEDRTPPPPDDPAIRSLINAARANDWETYNRICKSYGLPEYPTHLERRRPAEPIPRNPTDPSIDEYDDTPER